MFSYSLYKVMHFVGLFLLMVSLGGMILHMMMGGTREYAKRRFIAISHGVGMALVLVAGFGLLARLGLATGWPGWVHAKLVIWLALGVLPVFVYRKGNLALTFWALAIVLGGLGAYLAQYKPF